MHSLDFIPKRINIDHNKIESGAQRKFHFERLLCALCQTRLLALLPEFGTTIRQKVRLGQQVQEAGGDGLEDRLQQRSRYHSHELCQERHGAFGQTTSALLPWRIVMHEIEEYGQMQHPQGWRQQFAQVLWKVFLLVYYGAENSDAFLPLLEGSGAEHGKRVVRTASEPKQSLQERPVLPQQIEFCLHDQCQALSKVRGLRQSRLNAPFVLANLTILIIQPYPLLSCEVIVSGAQRQM